MNAIAWRTTPDQCVPSPLASLVLGLMFLNFLGAVVNAAVVQTNGSVPLRWALVAVLAVAFGVYWRMYRRCRSVLGWMLYVTVATIVLIVSVATGLESKPKREIFCHD